MKIARVDSFCHNGSGGNPAGVAIVKQFPTASEMQAAACALQFSETVFTIVSERTLTMRFFTPSAEVDLCGHATLAMLSELWRVKAIDSNILYTIKCANSSITGYVDEEGVPHLQMPNPLFGEYVANTEIAPTLGLTIDEIGKYGCRIVNVGLPDIFIGVKNFACLKNLQPDYDLIAAISRKYSCTGYHVFDESNIIDNTVYCRNFAPLVGINEESATGTANSALACLLAVGGAFGSDSADKISVKLIQGMFMNNSSEIIVNLKLSNSVIKELWLSGKTKYIEIVHGG
ncbi:MAG: PhzF family phenazine biosynthesis protein [Negativicutes bacterium]|jgi:PhzF family phenazine biosynthesis protein